MSDWKTLNDCRERTGTFASNESDGFNGRFRLKINGLNLIALASDGEGWQHVSVTIYGSPFTPSWDIMCKVKDLFWDEQQWVMQFHPAKSEYVNNHPGCLHLWRPTDKEFPVPKSELVGFKASAITIL